MKQGRGGRDRVKMKMQRRREVEAYAAQEICTEQEQKSTLWSLQSHGTGDLRGVLDKEPCAQCTDG